MQPGIFCGAAGDFLCLGKALGGFCTVNTPLCVSPSHPLRVPRGWRGHAAFLPSPGEDPVGLGLLQFLLFARISRKLFRLHQTRPPSAELDCSSLVTLLLNNLQNGALPVFIREAFQVCAADFYAFLVQLPGGGSCLSLSCRQRHLPERKRPLHVHRDPRKSQGGNPCVVPCPVGVLQARCCTGALGKGHSQGGLMRRCLGFVSVSFSG